MERWVVSGNVVHHPAGLVSDGRDGQTQPAPGSDHAPGVSGSSCRTFCRTFSSTSYCGTRVAAAYSETAARASRARSRQARHAVSYVSVCGPLQPPSAVGDPYWSRSSSTRFWACSAARCSATSSSKVRPPLRS